MSDNRPLGILDSGSGGLTIRQSICAMLPHESTVYIGDHAHIPYSSKSGEFIRNRIGKLIAFLIGKNAKLIVIACNTATVAGIDEYRSMFPRVPIVGVVPVIKTAAKLSAKRNFAVLSTAYTAASWYQKELIARFAPDCTVHNIGSSKLVGLVEEGNINGPETWNVISALLTPEIARQIDVLALGCTHYPFLTPVFRSILGDAVDILDSGDAVARQVLRILNADAIASGLEQPNHDFFTTGDSKKVTHTMDLLLTDVSPVVKEASIP